ncbi:MAG TPA: hypothetical protein VEA59_01195, partial [Patescibacteria group bacterium]|nr:hypothetical protein [Patescibacteria group bacterium]
GPYVIRLPGHVVFGLASEPNMWMESETCTWHSRTDIWTRYPTKPESILSKAFGELYARDRILAIYYARLGNRLLKLGKHTEGKRYLWNSTRPDAWDISGISSLADVLVKSKLEQEVKEGIRLLAWSISLNTTPEENEALAKLYISQKKWSEARDLLTKAVSCFPANESLKELKKIACKQAKC